MACRSCGTEVLDNARFCHGCGSALAATATRAGNYRDLAKSLGFEGHIDWAEAMP
ncbi:MAG TPA: zinc ribbon domain-containing protein [Mycobacterium sp.]|nr:zinc ribbon domain-containing protein [Mycobacterium sp.]